MKAVVACGYCQNFAGGDVLPPIGMPARIAVLLALLVALTGCQTLKLAMGPEMPALVAPQLTSRVIQVNQRLEIRQPGSRPRRLLAVITLSPESMQLNGLSVTGQRLLEVRWDGDSLDTWQAPGLEKRIPAEWLLAQIQLAYLSETVLHRHYRGNWSLQTDTGKRQLLLEGQANITVTCRAPSTGGGDCLAPDASVRIEHHPSGLVIKADTLKVVDGEVNENTTGRGSVNRSLAYVSPGAGQ